MEQSSLFSRESSFDSSSVDLAASLRFPSHEEPRSEGYDEYFDPPLESKYECPICFLGLREPVQTRCGHRFCRGCIVRSIRDGDSKCPVDTEHLSLSQIYPDNFAKREMMAHQVFCQMKKQHGCTWKGPLSKLQEHLKRCPCMVIDCTNNCGQQLLRKDVSRHLENDCPLRTVTCNYCEADRPCNELENHHQSCAKYPLPCDRCRTENIPRDKMAEHLKKECPEVEVECPFNTLTGCEFKGLRPETGKHVEEQMPSHMVDVLKKHQNQIDEMKQYVISGLPNIVHYLEQQAAENHRSAPGSTRAVMESLFQEQARHVHLNELSARSQPLTSLSNELHHLNLRVQEGEGPVQDLSLRLNHWERKLTEYEGRIYNGTYLWRIENYQQCRQGAFNMYSLPFYISLYGYKLCLRICIIGNHVALFIHIMQGDYDNILKWPFTGRITLSILDQSGAEFCNHISRTFLAKPNLAPFQRPTSPLNILGYGYPEFAPVAQICEPQYVKNNTMLVKFEFHPF